MVYADDVKNLSAKGEVINVQTSLLVRNAPSKSGDIIGSLKNGEKVTITGETSGWYKISYYSSTGYVSKSYISATALNDSTVVAFNATGYVKANGGLNVRSKATASSAIIGALENGKSVTIIGESAGWYQIRFNSGNGFVSKDYIVFNSSSSGNSSNSGSAGASITGTVKVNTRLLVRKQASSSGAIIGSLTNGKVVTITGESNGYYQIKYNSSVAYVSKAYVTTSGSTNTGGSTGGSSSATNTGVSSVSKTGYANVSTSLLIRREPSSSSATIGRYSSGAAIQITGELDNWYRVSYSGKTGYVNKAYVSFEKVTASGYRKISLSVPLYHQYDSRWASVKIGSTTLKASGCTTACLAMVREYRTGTTCTPADMVRKLQYTAGGSVYWPSGTTQYTGSNYLAVIYQQLAAGNPVIVGAKYKNSSKQHYVVVTGYNGSSTKLTASGFTVNDPGVGSTKTLSAFFSRTPDFYKLVYYR